MDQRVGTTSSGAILCPMIVMLVGVFFIFECIRYFRFFMRTKKRLVLTGSCNGSIIHGPTLV